ncbi:MAG: hypothetical protein ABIZ56_02980 [Chthoniobacteraceae bacterium]
MRPIIYLIIIAAVGYLGYNYYIQRIADASAESDTSLTQTAEAQKDPVTGAPATPEKTVQVFKSKIVIPDGPPGEKHIAKPGVYYVLERTSIEHATGVAAVVPGEEVRLLNRKENGIVSVKSGKHEFELKESQLTNDLDVAQEAERKFALTHPPARQQ